MRHAIVLITSLLAFLAFSPGAYAQDAGSATPAAPPAAATNAFEIGPEPGADPVTTDQGFFVYELVAGDEATGSVRVTNPGTEPVTIELAEVDAETAQTGGSSFADAAATPAAAAMWLSLDESRVTLEPGEQTSVAFTVQPPAGTAPGQYLAGITAFVPAATNDSGAEVGQAGASVTMQTRYVIGVQVDVPGEWTPEMTITGASAMEQPSGTKLGIAMENTGDTFIRPEGKVTLSNAEATPILTQPIALGTFLTGTELTYPVAWPGAPLGGDYGVDVELNYGDNQVASYRGMLTVSDNAPVAAPVPNEETQPVASPLPAPEPASSFIQPWMILAIIGLLALMVVGLAVALLRSRRSAW